MAQQAHTHWKKMSNPEYLGAYAFEPGEEKTATISVVQQEMVTGPDGKKEQCLVAHFQDDMKPMILNATNCKTISNLLKTPYIEDWVGKKISLHVEQVRAFGDLVDAVRVMKRVVTPKANQSAPAAPKCENCKKEITGIAGYTAEQIAATNKQRYGKCLCVECGKKRKEEIEAEKAAQTAAEPAQTEQDETDGNDVSAELLAGVK